MKGDVAKPTIPAKEPGVLIFERKIPQPHTLGFRFTPGPPLPEPRLRCEVYQEGHNRVYFNTGRDKAAAILWKRGGDGKEELVGVLWEEDVEKIREVWGKDKLAGVNRLLKRILNAEGELFQAPENAHVKEALAILRGARE